MKTRRTTLQGLFQFNPGSSSGSVAPIQIPYDTERYLILTADDFGVAKNVNEGIKIAADMKSISTISALTNFTGSLPDLKRISDHHPEIGIGVHLNITTGNPVLGVEQVPSLASANGSFYAFEALLPKINRVSLADLRNELRAQILALVKNDIRLDHLSYHFGVLSLYSPFYDIVMELAREFKVPVRTPVIASVKYPGVFRNSEMKKRGHKIALRLTRVIPFKALSMLKYSRIYEMEKKVKKLDDFGLLHPDLFIDSFWGNPTASNLLHILEHLPKGISEISFHFGTYSRQEDYPSGLELDYFKNRENELLTVTGEYLKEYFRYLNIKTIGFSEISKYKK